MMRNQMAVWGALASVAVAGQALGQLANGSFETGDFTSWTVMETGSGALIAPGVLPDGSTLPFVNPSQALDGRFSAALSFDGDASYTNQLFQDVAIADLGPSTVATFETNHRIQYDSLGIPSTLDRIFEITVRDPSDNSIIETLFSQTVNISGMALTDLGYDNNTFDLSGYAGQTIRLSLDVQVQESFTGPGVIEYDAIGLRVVPAPASLALLGMGGFAAMRRRR